MRHLYLLIVSLTLTGCSLFMTQEKQPLQQQIIQPQANLTINCIIPPEIPQAGSSYRDLESWGIKTLEIWAKCAKDKKALVDSWPKEIK